MGVATIYVGVASLTGARDSETEFGEVDLPSAIPVAHHRYKLLIKEDLFTGI